MREPLLSFVEDSTSSLLPLYQMMVGCDMNPSMSEMLQVNE